MVTTMKRLFLRLSTVALISCFVVLFTSSAQETARNGTPSKTYMKARTDAITLTTTPFTAFTTTTITCTAKCFFDITVSAQFNAVTSGAVAVVEVTVDGSQNNVLPYAVLGFDSTSTGGDSNVRSYTWMTNTLTASKHTVDVSFFTDAGTAESFDRTLKIVSNKE
jgi:hypothetical protein